MRVQVVADEMPLRHAWIALDGAANVGEEVGLGAGRADRWANDLPADHIKIDHERQRAVADVLELAPLDFTGSQRQARRRTLQGLNTSHFVGTDDSLPGSHARRRFPIGGTHIGGLLITFFVWLVFGGCQPRPNQVGLEIHLF